MPDSNREEKGGTWSCNIRVVYEDGGFSVVSSTLKNVVKKNRVFMILHEKKVNEWEAELYKMIAQKSRN